MANPAYSFAECSSVARSPVASAASRDGAAEPSIPQGNAFQGRVRTTGLPSPVSKTQSDKIELCSSLLARRQQQA